MVLSSSPLIILLVLLGIDWLAAGTHGLSFPSGTTVFALRFETSTSTFVTPQTSLSSETDRPSVAFHSTWQSLAFGHKLYRRTVLTSLHVHKKSGGGGGGDAVSKKGKMQVQLLETIPNMGQSGDIILVSSAVFQNQLKRGNKARLITDEEVERMEQKKLEEDQKMIEMAMQTKNLLEEAMIENIGGEDQCGVSMNSKDDICGVALQMKRKAGPEGNLFGGVNTKMILDALKERYPTGHWEGRQIKLLDMRDSNGNDVKAKDIKHVGDYTVRVSLFRGIEVTFILSIFPE